MDHQAVEIVATASLAAVTANGAGTAILVPPGGFEAAVYVTTTGGPTAANVTTDLSFDGGTTWTTTFAAAGTVAAGSKTAETSAVFQLPPGTTHVRHVLAGLAGGVTPSVTARPAFRRRF